MKFNILILAVACLVSCKSLSNLSNDIKEPIVQEASTDIEGYESTISITPNKSLEFKSDKFNNTFVEVNDGEQFVLKYEIKKIEDPKLPDGRYSEIIYAELPANFKEMILENEELQKIKLHSAKFCFCENANTYEPIENGVFQMVKRKDDEITIRFDFSLKNSSRKITTLSEHIFLK